MTDTIRQLAERPEVLVGGLLASVLILVWVARRVRRIAKSDRPDRALSRLAMLIGLGWSSEAIWELTGRIPGFPTELRFLVFFVLEVLLVLSMIRAERHVREHGWPGRSGNTAWVVAVAMSVVAGAVSHSVAEALLRMAIPVLLTKQWWDGLFTGDVRRPEWVTSWRWTPRRLLLALGAIEPGDSDVETVHRQRLTQQMTRLEFRRRHGSTRSATRAAAKLARLSLTADDDIVADVRSRVDRASWFEPTQAETGQGPAAGAIPAAAAASQRLRKVRHHSLVRKVHVTHPRPVIIAAQEPEPDPRSTQEIDDAICVMKTGDTALSHRKIAYLLRTSDAKVSRVLRRRQIPAPPPVVNGRQPEIGR